MSPLPPELAALDLQPRASQPQSPVWTLAQALAASPVIAVATVAEPRLTQTLVPIARGVTLADAKHTFIRVQHTFAVSELLRGALPQQILVDAPLWQRQLHAHRQRVLQGRDLAVSVPRVVDGLLAVPQSGEQVVVLLRQTAAGLEFAAANALLHVELLPVVRALLLERNRDA